MAVSSEQINRIIRAAAAAPSGDNSQPWRFVFRAPDMLEFHALPERDHPLLNVEESGTLLALGAALQNAELEAKALGFAPEIRYMEAGAHIATCFLRGNGALLAEERELEKAIPLRHSNRKAYKKTPFKESDRQLLLGAAGQSSEVKFLLIENRGLLKTLSRALTTMEEVALQNQTLHKLFFGSIFWSEKENREGVSGLYIRTLELPPPARLLFRALRHWNVAKLFARIGFPGIVANANAKQNASASGFGVLVLRANTRRAYLEAGQLLERVWLAAASRGLSLQIVTGLLFAARALQVPGNTQTFSDEEREKISAAYAAIRENLGGEEPFLMFRIGYGAPPTAVSYRREPVVDI